MKTIKHFSLITILIFAVVLQAQTIPDKRGTMVNDFAGIMAPGQISELELTLRNYEKKTSIEIAVVTIKTLEESDIDGYANELFKKWGIGKKGENNGILILISLDERKWRIETGYGLEPWLTDLQAGYIGRNDLVPNFKRGDYFGGIKLALNDIIKDLGESDWATRKDDLQKKKQTDDGDGFLTFLYILFFISVIAGIWISIHFLNKVRKAKSIAKKEMKQLKNEIETLNSRYIELFNELKDEGYSLSDIIKSDADKDRKFYFGAKLDTYDSQRKFNEMTLNVLKQTVSTLEEECKILEDIKSFEEKGLLIIKEWPVKRNAMEVGQIDQMELTIKELKKKYSPDIWEKYQPDEIDELLKKNFEFCEASLVAIQKSYDGKNVGGLRESINDYMNAEDELKTIINYPLKLKEESDRARLNLITSLNRLRGMLDTKLSYQQNPIYESKYNMAKMYFDEVSSLANQNNQNWIQLYSKVNTAINLLDEIEEEISSSSRKRNYHNTYERDSSLGLGSAVVGGVIASEMLSHDNDDSSSSSSSSDSGGGFDFGGGDSGGGGASGDF